MGATESDTPWEVGLNKEALRNLIEISELYAPLPPGSKLINFFFIDQFKNIAN